jgi:hypothetical protein
MKKLNGWQRIFVVIAVIWIPIVYSVNNSTRVEPSLYVHRILAVEKALERKSKIEAAALKAHEAGNADDVKVLTDAAKKFDPDAFLRNESQNPKQNWQEDPLVMKGKLWFEMPDGRLIEARSSENKKSDYVVAYQKALPDIRAAERKARIDYLVNGAQLYFAPLVVLYLLGWSVGWIRRGFKKPD